MPRLPKLRDSVDVATSIIEGLQIALRTVNLRLLVRCHLSLYEAFLYVRGEDFMYAG